MDKILFWRLISGAMTILFLFTIVLFSIMMSGQQNRDDHIITMAVNDVRSEFVLSFTPNLKGQDVESAVLKARIKTADKIRQKYGYELLAPGEKRTKEYFDYTNKSVLNEFYRQMESPLKDRKITSYWDPWRTIREKYTGLVLKAGPHHAIDMIGKGRILSVRPGRVISVGWCDGYGISIKIDHGDFIVSMYNHCDWTFVKVGQYVYMGQEIGIVGDTGNAPWGKHLDFQILFNGVSQNINGKI